MDRLILAWQFAPKENGYSWPNFEGKQGGLSWLFTVN
jgi:hypothetical protein